MKRLLKRVLVLVFGWGFILLGIVGLFLPILQGVLFILIGLFILSTEYEWAHNMLQRLRQRYPRVAHIADSARQRAHAWLRKIWRRERASDCAEVLQISDVGAKERQ